MRINSNNPALQIAQQRQVANSKDGQSQAVKSGPDKVSLSDEIQKMRQERLDRIESLKAQYESGDYDVDLDVLAQAIAKKEG